MGIKIRSNENLDNYVEICETLDPKEGYDLSIEIHADGEVVGMELTEQMQRDLIDAMYQKRGDVKEKNFKR